MQPKGYLIFHLNLAFSSIEEEAWPDVIQTCYHPVLQLVEETGIPVLIAEDPLTCVARGGGRAIEMMDERGSDIFTYE